MSSWLSSPITWDEKALGAFTTTPTTPTTPTPTQSTQASATWITKPIVWDDSALASFAPRTPAPTARPTSAPTIAPTSTPTIPPTPSPTPKATDGPALVALYAARSVPAIATIESSMYRGMFLKVYSSPDGGMAGTTSLDASPQDWHVGRGATMNSLVFRAGSSTGPVLSAGPGTECDLPVVWTSPAGARSQFIVNSTEENPDAFVISTIEQTSTGSCADGKVRFFTVQANGTLRLVRAKPTTATLLSYLWIIKSPSVTPTPTSTQTPEPTMAFTPVPTLGAPIQPSNINITVRDQPNSMFQYPVAPDLMVGGSIDPLLMSVVTDTPAPTPASTTAPATTSPDATEMPDPEFEDVVRASPQPNWTKWVVILCCLTALAVAGYLVYGKTMGKGKGGNKNTTTTGIGANNNMNNLNDLGDLGNLDLGNNAANNNLGAPPPTTGRKSS